MAIREKLTDRGVRALKKKDKPYRVFDGAGLYVEVTTAGDDGTKLWRMKYRFGGKEKRLALGRYPEVSLAQARDRAADARKILAQGIDPGEQKRTEKVVDSDETTFRSVALKWHEKERHSLSAGHAGRQLQRIERHVFPYVGDRSLESITAREWLEVLERIQTSGAIETAHRVRWICESVYEFANFDVEKPNPLQRLGGKLKAPVTKHMASTTDPDELKPLLRVLDGYHGTETVRVALLLGPLLFVRPGELRRMKWAEINEEKAEWRYVASKTKVDHIVPLSTQALALLKRIKLLTGDSPYVFPSARTRNAPMSDNAVNAALRRAGINTKTEMTGHGWRAAARTILDEHLGFRAEVLEMQLGHSVKGPLGEAYARMQFLDERRRLMQRWADFLDELRA